MSKGIIVFISLVIVIIAVVIVVHLAYKYGNMANVIVVDSKGKTEILPAKTWWDTSAKMEFKYNEHTFTINMQTNGVIDAIEIPKQILEELQHQKYYTEFYAKYHIKTVDIQKPITSLPDKIVDDHTKKRYGRRFCTITIKN